MSDKRGGVSQVIELAISEEINHLKGKKVDVLINPDGEVRSLYLECENGEYRIRIGDIPDADMPDDAIPKHEVTDGIGSVSLKDGSVRVIPAPEKITVRGLSHKSVLTYYWI